MTVVESFNQFPWWKGFNEFPLYLGYPSSVSHKIHRGIFIEFSSLGSGRACPTPGNGRARGGYPQGHGNSLKVGREAGE